MKNLINGINRNLKYLSVGILFIIIFFTTFLAGCNYSDFDKYSFEYTPNSITKEVGKTFNVFSLNYVTNLPSDIKNSLETYNDVEISTENENIVFISENSNEITTLNEGFTKINVAINYDNIEICSSFDLIINDISSSKPDNNDSEKDNGSGEDNNGENIKPSEEEVFNKGNLEYGFTYSYEIDDCFAEEGCIYYTLIITGDVTLARYQISVVNKNYRDLVWVESCGHSVRILYVFTDEEVEILITGILQNNGSVSLGIIVLKRG